MKEKVSNRASSLAGEGALFLGGSAWSANLRAALLAMVVTLAAYAPIFSASFVWNDHDYVTRPELQTLAGLKRIWCEFGATEQYYPLLHTVFWIEHRLWGEKAAAYHLCNVFLHVLAACLFAQLLIELFSIGKRFAHIATARAVAWYAALLFALHPVSVESVAWISEQKNTLSTVFYLGAALFFIHFYREGGKSFPRYLLATLLFVCALLTKSLTATLPGALCVALWWAEGTFKVKTALKWLLPWFALGGAMGVLSGWVEKKYVGAQGISFDLTALQRVLLAGKIVCFYLRRIVWPPGWVFIFPHWTIDPAVPSAYCFTAAVLLASVILVWIRRSRSAPLAAWLIFLGSLLPTLGFFNVYGFLFSYVADHWLYLPSLALLALIAGSWPSLEGWIGRATAVAFLAWLASLTWQQTHFYRDEETLYRSIIERNPQAWMAHDNLGIILASRGDLPLAILEYKTALALAPNNAEAHNNLGAAFLRSLQPAKALREFNEALRISPAFPEAYNNGGTALVQLGRFDEAEAEFETALELKPSYAQAHINLGTLLLHANHAAAAINQYQTALALDPKNADAHCNLGTAWEKENRLNDAIDEYRSALKIKPDQVEAHNDLGNALLKEKHFEEAVREYEEAVRLAPASIAIRANLGLALGYAGRFSDAAQAYRDLLTIDPNNTSARLQMEKAERMAQASAARSQSSEK